MPRPSPTPRQQPGRVVMQVARGGGATVAEAAEAVPTRGRHRTPDTGELPASGAAAGTAPAAGSSAAAGSSTTAGPSRHDLIARQAQIAARRTAPGSLDRVEAAQAAASRPASSPDPTAGPAAPASPAPDRTASPRPAAARPSVAEPGEDDAVTDLVAGPSRRGRAAMPDGPGTGPGPGLVGLALGVLALVGAVIAAAAPGVVVPVVGRLGASPLALAGLVALGLLATACAGLGTGRQRRGRGAAVTGMVVGLAAVAAAVVPLVALASL